MCDPEQSDVSPEQMKLVELARKIQAYQRSLGNDRHVELEELKREGVLDAADLEFLSSHSVTYKPHRVSDFHAVDMFHMPSTGGGCVFIGPSVQKLKKRRARLRDLRPVIENFLRLPRPIEELLLHIDFSEQDGMSASPELIGFALQSASWLERLPSIRAVAAECGFKPFQDAMLQGTHILTYRTSNDTAQTAVATVTLLGRGCGFAEEHNVTYSAGALDEAEVSNVRKSAVRYWERRRIFYNLALMPAAFVGYAVADTLNYVGDAHVTDYHYVLMWLILSALGANVCYSFAYALEFFYGTEDATSGWLRFGRTTIFVGGILFGMLLALMGGGNIANMEYYHGVHASTGPSVQSTR